jgi:hypothetical protein
VSQVKVREEAGKLEFIEMPTAKIPVIKIGQFLNLGVVIKPKVIVETIEAFLNEHNKRVDKNANI